MKNKKYNMEEKLEIIVEMWNDYTLEKIGERLGITRQAVSQMVHRLRKHGLDIPQKRTAKFDWKKFIDKHNKKQ